MSQREKITIKAKCNGVIRLLKIPKDLSYDAFRELLISSFGISNFQLQYSDEEGDLIELGSQDELKEAFKVGEKYSPLKITIITQETPTMSAMTSKPCDLLSNATQDLHSFGNAACENVSTEPISSSTVSEKPTPKPRPSRRRAGFYTSLCSDMNDLEIYETTTAPESAAKKDVQLKKKPKKVKAPHASSSSKYYTSLAEDVISMKLGQSCEYPQEQKKVKRKTEAPITQKKNVANGVKQVEKHPIAVSMSDEEPPRWFEKVVVKMSESVSSQVVGALNGAMITPVPTKAPANSIKRQGATYIHEGITCNGCQQTIVGARYKCGNCPNFDLCEECEAIEDLHDVSHVFVKLRFPGVGIGRRHGVMIPLLKDIIYKSKDVELAEMQDKRMKEVRKKLKQLAKKKREEQIGKKKADKKMKKFLKTTTGASNMSESSLNNGYELAFLGDGSYPDGWEVTPGLEFTKCWKIKNVGSVAWNKDTKLTYLYGKVQCMISTEVELPSLEPGQEGTVMVPLVAPLGIGEYVSVWRASHNEKNFGSKLWCKIKVVPRNLLSENDEIFLDAEEDNTIIGQMQESIHVSKPDIKESSQSDPIFHAYTIQQSEEEEVNSSQNANNSEVTTSDIPLLDCNELEWDTCSMDNDNPLIVNEGEVHDIEVISNASSDDFCVVPLPACFDPDIPLDIEDFPHNFSVTTEVPLGSPVNQQEPNKEYEEQQSLELAQGEFECDETIKADNDVREISSIPDSPTTPNVLHDVPMQTTSVPINIETKSTDRNLHPLTTASCNEKSTISEPVVPQPAVHERNSQIGTWLPASPPGRAVPVVQIQVSKPQVKSDDPVQNGVDRENANQSEWQAVRTQPLDNVIHGRQISEEEETVTIQPRGTPGAVDTNQSTAHLASTFVTGTLKRAIGSVTDTVSSFINVGASHSAVVYETNESGDNVRVIDNSDSKTVSQEFSSSNKADMRVLMKQLHEMGFCDRPLNESLLRKCNNDVSRAVTELLHINDNNWSAARH